MEIREVDRFIKKNTIDRFGPVRQVKPELVFETFEVLLRHLVTKVVLLYVSQGFYVGVMKKIADANTINDLKQFLREQSIYG